MCIRDSHKTIPTNTLCDLIRMILTMNNFSLVIIKGEIIHGENHTNKVTECASGNGFVGGSA